MIATTIDDGGTGQDGRIRCLRTIVDVRAQVRAWRNEGLTVGFVPTMGALHQGHLSLVERSSTRCERTLVSIFVNPIQFDRDDDFAMYPREARRDLGMLQAGGGCDAVFSPLVEELFPDGRPPAGGFDTEVSVQRLSRRLCGVHRPGHFAGVATQVMKLLMIAQPDVAIFGEKDYQQLQLIRRMVRDLNVPVVIDAGPTVREADGLAMSSRNAYLSAPLRAVAPLLFETLVQTAGRLREGADVSDALAAATRALVAGGFREVDYVSLVDEDTLETQRTLDNRARLLAAGWLGPARLIDNIAVGPPDKAA